MFTNNYINLQKKLFCYSTEQMVKCDGQSVSPYSYPAPHYYGNIGYCMGYGRCMAPSSSTFSVTGVPVHSSSDAPPCGAYFGSGATPATKNDYTLESVITSGLSITSSSVAIVNSENGIYSAAADYIVRNTSTEDINIQEIGIFTPLCVGPTKTGSYGYSTTASMEYALFLMERSVLDEPVTIPAGESRLITYKLVFNHS